MNTLAIDGSSVGSMLTAYPMLVSGIVMGVAAAVARKILQLALWAVVAVVGVVLVANPEAVPWLWGWLGNVGLWALARASEAWNWFVDVLEL